jgi:pimeloyl-ACP methyl ester carboxylesterase
MDQETIYDTGEIQLNYAEGGTKGKPAMVLLHGLTGRWQAYTDTFDEYDAHWHLYAPDLRGHGNSSKPESGYSLPDYAGDVIAFLEDVVREPVVLVGHSLGALITLAVAHLAPERLRALIANDPPLLGDDLGISDFPDAQEWFSWVYQAVRDHPSFEQVMASCAALNPGTNQAELHEMAEQISGVAPGTVRAALDDRQKEGYDLHAALQTIRCPTLLLYGDRNQGSVVRDKDAVEFKQLIPQAVVHKFHKGDHMLWWKQSETRKRIVQEFLNHIE